MTRKENFSRLTLVSRVRLSLMNEIEELFGDDVLVLENVTEEDTLFCISLFLTPRNGNRVLVPFHDPLEIKTSFKEYFEREIEREIEWRRDQIDSHIEMRREYMVEPDAGAIASLIYMLNIINE